MVHILSGNRARSAQNFFSFSFKKGVTYHRIFSFELEVTMRVKEKNTQILRTRTHKTGQKEPKLAQLIIR
ncbi:MAG: hypothetical protein K1000chlam3_01029 [Chlamydiae bacterium]|nr:hypothetical protein [Chlamydiota bacterium]